VAHGAVESIFPAVPLVATSLLFCLFIYLMTIKKNKVIPALGTILTPLLLAAIGAIAFFAYKDAGVVSVVTQTAKQTVGTWGAFKNGFLQGYQTMDLLAAFFFSVFVIKHLEGASEEGEKSHLKVFLKSAAFGGGILAAVYCILVSLGSIYSVSLATLPPQDMLGHIAMQTLGTLSGPCLCVLVVLACFTTAIVLASLFAEFIGKEVCRGKLHPQLAMLVTLAIGFLVSTLGFSGIAKFLGPLLQIVYPSLIVLTLVNIAHKFWGMKNSHWPVTLTFLARLCMAI
jgi:LIVCS family branched-chain amino acid:cation transporter